MAVLGQVRLRNIVFIVFSFDLVVRGHLREKAVLVKRLNCVGYLALSVVAFC